MAAWDQQPGESAKAYATFCIYRDLGAGRTLQKVAQECNKSVSLVGRWSSLNSWQSRVAAWDEATRQETLPIAVQTQVEAIASLGKLDVAVREARLADYELVRTLALETIEARKVDAREQMAQFEAYEAKRRGLLEMVEVCRVALLETDREDSEAFSAAETDLKKAEGELTSHMRWSSVQKPPRAALLGAMVRDVKSVGRETVEVWKWDDAPLRTLMAADKQAAEDLGQWLQRLKLDVGELQDDQLLRLLAGETLDGDADPH